MIDDNFEFRSSEIARSSELLEYNILKRTVLRKSSPIVGVYYSMCILKGSVCQLRTMEHGSLIGSVKSVKNVLEGMYPRNVNVNVVCTVDDVKFLRQPHCREVFPSRFDDVKKIQDEAREIARYLQSDPHCPCDAGFLFVVIDRGGGILEVCENVFGDWSSTSLRDSIRSCFPDVIGKSGPSKSFCLSNLAQNSLGEDWEIGNCLPNFDTNLSWVTYDKSRLMREHGKIKIWRQHSFKARYLKNWKGASIEQCILSVTEMHESVNGMPSRTFKKRRSDHGKIGVDFGEFTCMIYIELMMFLLLELTSKIPSFSQHLHAITCHCKAYHAMPCHNMPLHAITCHNITSHALTYHRMR